MNLDHYSALARLINLLRRAGKLDDCSKYLEQVSVSVILVLRSVSKLIFLLSSLVLSRRIYVAYKWNKAQAQFQFEVKKFKLKDKMEKI